MNCALNEIALELYSWLLFFFLLKILTSESREKEDLFEFENIAKT